MTSQDCSSSSNNLEMRYVNVKLFCNLSKNITKTRRLKVLFPVIIIVNVRVQQFIRSTSRYRVRRRSLGRNLAMCRECVNANGKISIHAAEILSIQRCVRDQLRPYRTHRSFPKIIFDVLNDSRPVINCNRSPQLNQTSALKYSGIMEELFISS